MGTEEVMCSFVVELSRDTEESEKLASMEQTEG